MVGLKTWIAGALLMTGLITPAEAAFGSIHCAGRSIGDAYRDPHAVALVRAAARGDSEEVLALANRKPQLVNTLEEGAVPPLLWAICADNVAGFEALLKAGADPNLAGNGSGRGDGKGHGVREDGSVISAGWSAMLMAAGAGQPDFLKLAIRYGGDLNAAKGARRPNRPLLMAAYHGLFENVRLLVAAGADINVRDQQTSTPEYALGVTGRFDIAVWILEHSYSNDLQSLAGNAEVSQVRLDGEQQRWKEKLIFMLRERGAVFPASPGVKRAIAVEREVPSGDIEDIILGRKNILDYPKKGSVPR